MYGSRMCVNINWPGRLGQTGVNWQRDVNANRNIIRRVAAFLNNDPVPLYLTSKQDTEGAIENFTNWFGTLIM